MFDFWVYLLSLWIESVSVLEKDRFSVFISDMLDLLSIWLYRGRLNCSCFWLQIAIPKKVDMRSWQTPCTARVFDELMCNPKAPNSWCFVGIYFQRIDRTPYFRLANQDISQSCSLHIQGITCGWDFLERIDPIANHHILSGFSAFPTMHRVPIPR